MDDLSASIALCGKNWSCICISLCMLVQVQISFLCIRLGLTFCVSLDLVIPVLLDFVVFWLNVLYNITNLH